MYGCLKKVIWTVLTFEDKTYRGVEIAVHTSVVGFETSLNTASCNVCTIGRVSQAKWPQNRFYRHLEFENFLGGDPPNPLTRGG